MIAEKLVLDHLNKMLDVPVKMEHPVDEEAYVILERVGGSRDSHIPRASFAIQSYASTLYDACVLNEQVKDAMEALINDPNVSSVGLDSDYNYTDETSKRYRYQAVYDLVFFND